MPGNSIGTLFKVTTFGASHGAGIGCVIDGFPSNFPLDLNLIQHELDRRKPGQSKIVTQRNEPDSFEVLSGLFQGKTTGTPLTFFIKNRDQKSKDYSHIKDSFRPSHADYTYHNKYGNRDYRGGGRSSARETAARVVAGAIAKQYLSRYNILFSTYVSAVGDLELDSKSNFYSKDNIESNIVRCPEPILADKMIEKIKVIKKAGNTIGGKVTCVIQNCPIGIGEPVFDKLHAQLGYSILSINACKGIEFGSGFAGTEMLGSDHNDIFDVDSKNNVYTKTNNSGGIQGGISNGMPIYMTAAFKPVATIMSNQQSVDIEGNLTTVTGKGRHDPCVVPRAVPIVEAMAAIILLDNLLVWKAYK